MANFSKKKQQLQKGGANNGSLTDSFDNTKYTEITNVKEWVKQILFWRTHLDIFIEDYFSTTDNPIKFEDFQRVIVRAAGNCRIWKDNESRGLGKTWKMSLITPALAVLYPDNKILIVSKNVAQAIGTINYIESLANNNDNIKREIIYPIRISKDSATIDFKNGSQIKAKAMSKDGSSLRGERAKVVFIDEAALIPTEIITKVIMPILQWKRPVWWKLKDRGFEDFPSKLFEATSASLRATDYYQRMKNVVSDIKNSSGIIDKFACCISYETGLRLGMIEEEKIEDDRKTMGEDVFDMEYGCIFKGNTNDSFYPYELTSKCRILETVELYQAKNSTSRYVASLDVATSDAKGSDNAVLSVIKFNSKSDGTYTKQLVYMIAYNGVDLQGLANEVRKISIRFPSIEKIIIDANALGEGVVALLQNVYVDPETNKEYPPFVEDTMDISLYNGTAIPIIWAYKGTNILNNKGAIALKMFLENKSLQLPVASMQIKSNINKKKAKDILIEETSVFLNCDSLIYEMSNIKPITLTSGVKYDVPAGKHKDRYSSLMMACLYIYNLEEQNKLEKLNNHEDACLAMTFGF